MSFDKIQMARFMNWAATKHYSNNREVGAFIDAFDGMFSEFIQANRGNAAGDAEGKVHSEMNENPYMKSIAAGTNGSLSRDNSCAASGSGSCSGSAEWNGIDIIPGKLITKDMRHTMFGNVSGGSNTCKPEKYQRDMLEKHTGLTCSKTNMRMNLRNYEMKEIAKPNMVEYGFDFTEDFDGEMRIANGKRVFVNFKCISGAGGSQTRSLREVYWFVEGQLRVLLSGIPAVYFANILDGDEAHKAMDKFKYLLGLPEFSKVAGRVYVGDLAGYIAKY